MLSMPIEVPSTLKDRVHVHAGGLRYQRVPMGGPAYVLDQLPGLWGRQGITSGTVVSITKDGIRFGRHGRMRHRGQTIRLVGAPGEPANLFVNGAQHPLLYTSIQAPGTGPWSTHDVLWLGRVTSALLGIPWRVEWDRDGWDRWNHDAQLRGRTTLALASRKSKEQFRDFHRYQLEEPPGTVNVEGATYLLGEGFSAVTVHLEPDQVRSPRWKIPWESIHGTATVFATRPGMRAIDGFLRVAYQDEILDLVHLPDLRPIDAAHLRWLESEVKRRSQAPRRAKGSPADVPVRLRDLRTP